MDGTNAARMERQSTGACLALVVLAALLVSAGAMFVPASSNAHVYWTNYGDGSIGRANNDATHANQNVITGLRSPVGVAVNGSHAFISQQAASTIARANLDGTGLNLEFISGTQDPYQLAANGSHLYWSAFQGAYSVSRAKLDGTGFDPKFVTGGSPVGLALSSGDVEDSGYVYYSNVHTNTIGRARLGANPRVGEHEFIRGANNPNGLAVDDKYVYWTNTGAGTIGRARLDGTDVDQSFIIGASTPFTVAVDREYVYWTNFSAHTIGRARLDGSEVKQDFITGAKQPAGLAVDDRWTGPDGDGDGTPDAGDNCPSISNADQANNDRDSLGNACDSDREGSGGYGGIGTNVIDPRGEIEGETGSWAIDTSNPATTAGVLSSIDYWSSRSGQIRFFVTDAASTVKWVSPEITTASSGRQSYGLYSPIRVAAGDRIGVYWPESPVLAYEEDFGAVELGSGGSAAPVRRDTLRSRGSAARTYSFGAKVHAFSPLFTASATLGIGSPTHALMNRQHLDGSSRFWVVDNGQPATRSGTIRNVWYYAAATGDIGFFLVDPANRIKHISLGVSASATGLRSTFSFSIIGGTWRVAPGDRLGFWSEGTGVIPYDVGTSTVAFSAGSPGSPGNALKPARSYSRFYSFGASITPDAPGLLGNSLTRCKKPGARITDLVASNVGCGTARKVARATQRGTRVTGFKCKSKRHKRGRAYTCTKGTAQHGISAQLTFVVLRR